MYFVVGYKLLSSNLWTCGHVVSIQPCELQTFGRASLLVMLPQGYAEQSGFFCFFLPNSTLVKLFSVLQREGCTLCCLVFHFCQRRTPIITTELWGYGICKCVCVRESCCGAMWYCGRPGLVSAWNLAWCLVSSANISPACLPLQLHSKSQSSVTALNLSLPEMKNIRCRHNFLDLFVAEFCFCL